MGFATDPTADSREQAVRIRQAWSNLDSSRTYGGITLAEFEAALNSYDAAEAQLASLTDQIDGAKSAVRARHDALWALVKRARTGAKAQFGDDSEEYSRFGGTRASERKRPRARVKS